MSFDKPKHNNHQNHTKHFIRSGSSWWSLFAGQFLSPVSGPWSVYHCSFTFSKRPYKMESYSTYLISGLCILYTYAENYSCHYFLLLRNSSLFLIVRRKCCCHSNEQHGCPLSNHQQLAATPLPPSPPNLWQHTLRGRKQDMGPQQLRCLSKE